MSTQPDVLIPGMQGGIIMANLKAPQTPFLRMRDSPDDVSFGPPEDVAGLVVFLASPAAAEITGQAVGLDGDRLAL